MDLSSLISSGMKSAEATQLLLNVVWTMIGSILVFFMQAGFAACETGFTRAKNAANITMKNLMDFVIGTICFYLIGFAIMFGGDAGGVIGFRGFFDPASLADAKGIFHGLTFHVFLIFQTVFCATSATIVSGSMAGRTKFSAYLIYSACISTIIYPITGNWIWGGGWLSELGFHDFAGSTAVHMVGGTCALVGAKILGPRIGKYRKDGSIKAFPGHNIPFAAMGVFILWFCWFGFNCGSTTAATTNLGDIAVTTNLAAAAATLTTLLVTWQRYGKPDVSMTLNAVLAGLVAITAGCDIVSDPAAIIIGIVAGIIVVFSVEYFDKIAKIDDPVGAISVHGVCGAVGTILTGLLVKGSALKDMGFSRIQFLGLQVLGVVSVAVFVVIMAIIIFKVIDKTVGLRVSEQEEIDGLDIHEHGIVAYANFRYHDDK